VLGATVDHDEDDVLANDAALQLDEYFAGERRDFDIALDWRLVRGFTRAALEAVREIPYGETAGYGEVAVSAGSPGAARAVGTACATTPFSIVVPVHRVVRADGSIGEYGGHPEVKAFLLELERAASV
jgi:methylated-DNA-[protein]-cysteine S-methyltransferase